MQIPNLIKIRPVGAELFHANGQTDRQNDEANNRFSQFYEKMPPKNGQLDVLNKFLLLYKVIQGYVCEEVTSVCLSTVHYQLAKIWTKFIKFYVADILPPKFPRKTKAVNSYYPTIMAPRVEVMNSCTDLQARLTLRLLMSYIYIYIYMEHLFLMYLDHTQRRSTVGRTPLDE